MEKLIIVLKEEIKAAKIGFEQWKNLSENMSGYYEGRLTAFSHALAMAEIFHRKS